jgi:hypothetical protein
MPMRACWWTLDILDAEDHENDPSFVPIDDGSVEPASSEEVTATETGFIDFDMQLGHVAEATVELGGDGFVDQHENDAEDDEEEEEDDERLRSFQLHEMGTTPRGTTGEKRAEICPATVYSALANSRSPCATSRTEWFCRQ